MLALLFQGIGTAGSSAAKGGGRPVLRFRLDFRTVVKSVLKMTDRPRAP